MASRARLHRAMFIEVGGEVVWDKEVGEVWEELVSRVERSSSTTTTTGGGGGNER